MRIQFSFVGDARMARQDDLWVDLPAVPREGEIVDVPGLSQHQTVVRTVVWYPLGHSEDGEPTGESFVYVVLGSPRNRDAAYQAQRDQTDSRSG